MTFTKANAALYGSIGGNQKAINYGAKRGAYAESGVTLTRSEYNTFKKVANFIKDLDWTDETAARFFYLAHLRYNAMEREAESGLFSSEDIKLIIMLCDPATQNHFTKLAEICDKVRDKEDTEAIDIWMDRLDDPAGTHYPEDEPYWVEIHNPDGTTTRVQSPEKPISKSQRIKELLAQEKERQLTVDELLDDEYFS